MFKQFSRINRIGGLVGRNPQRLGNNVSGFRAYSSKAMNPNTKLTTMAGVGIGITWMMSSMYLVDNESQEESDKPQKSDEDREPTAEDYDGAAYNPITGEINWDCPCLGGMAHGPCGEEFKEAFACFVYSETEPKGIDCIKKFEAMRTCFRRYPEVYKEQLMDEEELEAAHNEKLAALEESEATPGTPAVTSEVSSETTTTTPDAPVTSTEASTDTNTEASPESKSQTNVSDSTPATKSDS